MFPGDAGATSHPAIDELEQLVRRASAAPEAERIRMTRRIAGRLRRLPREAAPDAAGRWLLRALEESAWLQWADARGRTCRAAAVEALLALGYPWALHVTPEDLEHYRAQSRPGVAPGALARAFRRILRVFTRRPKSDLS